MGASCILSWSFFHEAMARSNSVTYTRDEGECSWSVVVACSAIMLHHILVVSFPWWRTMGCKLSDDNEREGKEWRTTTTARLSLYFAIVLTDSVFQEVWVSLQLATSFGIATQARQPTRIQQHSCSGHLSEQLYPSPGRASQIFPSRRTRWLVHQHPILGPDYDFSSRK